MWKCRTVVWSLLQAPDHPAAGSTTLSHIACLACPNNLSLPNLACSGLYKFVVACIAEFLGVLLFTFSGSATPTGTISTQQSNTQSGKIIFAECWHTVRAASESLPLIHMFGLQAMQVPTGHPGEWGNGWLPSAGRLHFGHP